MNITLHWWHVPTLVTSAYLLWAICPFERSGMWGDIDRMFGHIVGLFCVAVAWAAFAVGVIVWGAS